MGGVGKKITIYRSDPTAHTGPQAYLTQGDQQFTLLPRIGGKFFYESAVYGEHLVL
ncbi:hypothetical protein COLO4_29182 [Corchorus olitorius]|uniref:Uncharacterized protein n=1 Tax=Corchorus olitorius TaxID=93759 RepID=A0A1R3HFX0_9ROSI|nr:hypothetical protein COLO4_29182 [Corchorus olitorius]